MFSINCDIIGIIRLCVHNNMCPSLFFNIQLIRNLNFQDLKYLINNNLFILFCCIQCVQKYIFNVLRLYYTVYYKED